LFDDERIEAQIPSNPDSPQLTLLHKLANGRWINLQVLRYLAQSEHPCRHLLASNPMAPLNLD
jgi:hypothetical protein